MTRSSWSARAPEVVIVGVGKWRELPATRWRWRACDQIIYPKKATWWTCSGPRVSNADGRDITAQRPVRTVHAHSGAVELGPYRFALHAEGNFEQPRAIGDTLQGVEGIVPDLFGDNAAGVFNGVDSVLILACGTSYYSGLTAKYWLESIAKIPCNVEVASEYRYRDSVPNPRAGRHHLAVRRNSRHHGGAGNTRVAGPRAHAHHLQRQHQRDGARMRWRTSRAQV